MEPGIIFLVNLKKFLKNYWINNMQSILIVDDVSYFKYLLVVLNDVHVDLEGTDVDDRDLWIFQVENSGYLLVLSFHKLLH